jgi:hypothetical protein
VSRRASDDPTNVTQMSSLSCLAPFHENATCSPSGEKVGLSSRPVSVVRGTTRSEAASGWRGDRNSQIVACRHQDHGGRKSGDQPGTTRARDRRRSPAPDSNSSLMSCSAIFTSPIC